MDDMIFIVIEENDTEIKDLVVKPDMNYSVLMLGKPRPIEALFDLGTEVIKTGHRLVLNVNCNEHEIVVHNKKDLFTMCDILNMLNESTS